MPSDAVAAAGAPPRLPTICLVSMPFIPITSPGLGVSTLKSTLRDAGISSTIYYGALDYFRFFGSGRPPSEQLFDYNFLATNGDLGDVFFSSALWGGSIEPVAEAMEKVVASPSSVFSRAQREQIVERLLSRAELTDEFLGYCVDRWDFGRYDVVGFSTTFCQTVASLALARRIRERHPNVHVIFGGANCEGPMGVQLLRSFAWLDAVVRGEADHALPDYLRRIAVGEDVSAVPGVVFRDGAEVREGGAPQPLNDLDALPFPDFDDYYEQLPAALGTGENRHELQLPIETSRGCWWGAKSHCTFCGLNPTMMTYRAKSPERSVREFRRIRDYYRERKVCVVDNILSMTYFKETLPLLEELGLTIFYETKANLNEHHVEQLSRAGVRVIQPGIEALSSELLALMKKGVTASQNVALLKWCRIHDVKPIWFCLYGFPDERDDYYWQTISLMGRLAHLPPPQNPNPVVIDRFSPLFQSHEEFGLRNLRPLSRVDVYYRGLSAEERFNLTYHFEAELPQGQGAEYVLPLWKAVLEWQRRYASGASFEALEGDSLTLLLGDRRDEPEAFLLTGSGHSVHQLLRSPTSSEAVRRKLFRGSAASGQRELSVRDMALLFRAQEADAEAIASPRDEADLERFLADLDERWITAVLDDRHVALALERQPARASSVIRSETREMPVAAGR